MALWCSPAGTGGEGRARGGSQFCLVKIAIYWYFEYRPLPPYLFGSNSRCASWKRYGDARGFIVFFYYSSSERNRCAWLRRRSDFPINMNQTEIPTWIGIKAKNIRGVICEISAGRPKDWVARKIAAQWARRLRSIRRRYLQLIDFQVSSAAKQELKIKKKIYKIKLNYWSLFLGAEDSLRYGCEQ